jgi:hypothetical protein
MVFTKVTAEGSNFCKSSSVSVCRGSKRHRMHNHSEITHLTLSIVNDRKLINGEANLLSGHEKHTIVVTSNSTLISGPHQLTLYCWNYIPPLNAA